MTIEPAPSRLPRSVTRRVRAHVPRAVARMEQAILAEVPRYRRDPQRYAAPILQRCRMALRLFLHILESGGPPSPRAFELVRRVGEGAAREGEPLEPLLHALRIGARVGWDETLAASLDARGVPRTQLLSVAGQVFEYIDALSSRIAEAYAEEVERSVRSRTLSEAALFEDLVSGAVLASPLPARGRPRVAVALAVQATEGSASVRAQQSVVGRVRTRLPGAVAGQRHGASVWLLDQEPPDAVLEDCASGEPAAFGISAVGVDTSLAQAVDESVVAARLGLAIPPGADGGGSGRVVHRYSLVYPYAALAADPGALARSRQALLGLLLPHPALVETLEAYLRTGRSVSATAARVHRHRQSVVYRLARVSQILGIDLSDPEALFRLEAIMRSSPELPAVTRTPGAA